MFLNKEEYLASLKAKIGEDTSDESLKFLEDMTDTYDELSNRGSGEDWKTKYEELDKSWREKYKKRFFESDADQNNEPPVAELKDEDGDNLPKKIDDLFTVKEN